MFIYLADIKLHYDEQRPIKKNYHLTTLDYIGKEYKISFEVFVGHFKRLPYQSVIHFTAGPAYYGQRTPAVWLKPDRKVHVSSSISGISTYDDICCLVAQKWTKIEISQTLVGGKVGIRFYIISYLIDYFFH